MDILNWLLLVERVVLRIIVSLYSVCWKPAATSPLSVGTINNICGYCQLSHREQNSQRPTFLKQLLNASRDEELAPEAAHLIKSNYKEVLCFSK